MRPKTTHLARSALLGLTLLASACAPRPATEVVVLVTSDYAAGRQLHAVRLTAQREGAAPFLERSFSLEDQGFRLPGALTIAARDPSDGRRLLVAVEGTVQDLALPLRQEALVRFQPERTLYLQLSLFSTCSTVPCPEGLTCRDGTCVSRESFPVSLTPSSQDAGTDAGSSDTAAGVDATSEPSPDLDANTASESAPEVGADAVLDTPTMDTPEDRVEAEASRPDADNEVAEVPVALDADVSGLSEVGMERPEAPAPDTPMDDAAEAAGMDAPADGPPEVTISDLADLAVPESCPSGLTPCPGGCVDTGSAFAHCGGCGRGCAHANAASLCAAGSCLLGACAAGFGDCDRMQANGCEVDQRSSAAHCGACGTACPSVPRGAGVCVAGRCELSCERGFVARDGACAYDTPRPLAPLSGGWVGTRQPTLRWEALAGTEGTLVRICSARSCEGPSVEEARLVTGTTYCTTLTLTPGWHWWQLVGQRGGSFTAPSPTWQFFVGAAGMRELTLGLLPDFNGDGFGDLAVTVEGTGPSTDFLVYYGGATGLQTVPSQRFSTPDRCPLLSITHLGDVNGDGYSDLYGSCPGRWVPYFGGPSGLTQQTPYEGSADAMTVGDVDGDGFADAASTAGIHYGGVTGTSGFSVTRLSFPVSPSGTSGFGQAVAGADANGDGYADLAVGAPFWSCGATGCGGCGRVFVYLAPAGGGRRAMLAPSLTLQAAGPPGNACGQFGSSLEWIDADGDGRPDLAVGERWWEMPEPARIRRPGRVSCYYGDGASLATTPAFSRESLVDNTNLGYDLLGPGDLEGNGLPELVVGTREGLGPYLLSFSARGIVGREEVFPFLAGGLTLTAAAVGSVDSDARADVAVLEATVAPTTAGGLLHIYAGGTTLPTSPRQSISPPAGLRFRGLMLGNTRR